jgi:hypothetical protein
MKEFNNNDRGIVRLETSDVRNWVEIKVNRII